jgi:hypothetical protein
LIGIFKAKQRAELFSYVDEHSGDSTPIVMGSYSENRLAEELRKYPTDRFIKIVVSLGSDLYHLALRSDWRQLEGEDRKRSKNSCAEYLAELAVGRWGWLIQVVKPRRFWWARTSHHLHWWKWEWWRWIAGEHPIVRNGTGNQVLAECCSGPPCFFHQLKMRIALFRLVPALVLIIIFDRRPGQPDPLGMGDYHHVKQTV